MYCNISTCVFTKFIYSRTVGSWNIYLLFLELRQLYSNTSCVIRDCGMSPMPRYYATYYLAYKSPAISCRTSYLQKTGVLSNLTHFRFGNQNHTHHRKRLIFLSNLSWNNWVSISNRLRENRVLASFLSIHTDIMKLLYR